MSSQHFRYLIIGNSAGGIAAAEAIREVDQNGSLAIVSDEIHPAYSRPLISEYLAGQRSLRSMALRPPAFYKRNGIEAILGVRAQRIDFGEKSVELADGRVIGWEKLLLATGGSPIVPVMAGGEKEGVFTFTTLQDAQRLRRAVADARRAVVIGGGFIGLSAAQALAHRRLAVTIVELKETILSTMLDARAARLVEKTIRRQGVTVITGQSVREVLGRPEDEGRVGGVVLSNGTQVLCDLVVVAIGVAPRIELVAGSPVKVGRGIVVDRRMATSVPGVYACGDVAEAYDFLHGENRVTPIWPNAVLGGRAAGHNMADWPDTYAGGTAANSLNYFGLAITAAGVVDPADGSCEVLSASGPGDGCYRKVVLRDGRIVGLLFMGEIERSGVVYGLMRDGADVSAFKESLLSRGFGLASLPEELRRQKLGLPVGARRE
jgi:NAD(P)H-nitrite reductase large subunit